MNTIRLQKWAWQGWLMVFPWSTGWVLRQVWHGGSLWAAAGVLMTVNSVYLALLLAWYFIPQLQWSKKAARICVGLISILGIYAAVAADRVLFIQQIWWWSLGAGLIIFSYRQKIITQADWIWWLALGSIGPVCLSLFQALTQTNFSSTWFGLSAVPSFMPGAFVVVGEWGRWLRASGSFPHPNILAAYCVVVLAALFSLARDYSFSVFKKWSVRLLVGLLTAALLASLSRAGGLAWVLLIIWEHYRDWTEPKQSEVRLLLFISGLIMVLGMSVAWPLWKGRVTVGPSVQEKNSITERVTGYAQAWQIWQQSPFLGVGVGNYTVALAKQQPNLAGYALAPVHSVPSLFVVEWGIVGVIMGLIGAAYFGSILGLFGPTWLVILPFLLVDHFFYDTWPGILILAVHISSTVYPLRPKIGDLLAKISLKK